MLWELCLKIGWVSKLEKGIDFGLMIGLGYLEWHLVKRFLFKSVFLGGDVLSRSI